MPMRKFLLSLCVLAAGLLSAGCHDEIIQKIDELEDRVDDMTLMCNRLNQNLSTLQNLVEVIQRQDMINGITEIRSGSTVTGYRLEFVQHEPITIYNGSDGKKPLIASRLLMAATISSSARLTARTATRCSNPSLSSPIAWSL